MASSRVFAATVSLALLVLLLTLFPVVHHFSTALSLVRSYLSAHGFSLLAQSPVSDPDVFSSGVPLRSSIVAVGDLHGDYKNTWDVLRMAGVIDARGHWSGDVDVLVQTGDIIDRCVL